MKLKTFFVAAASLLLSVSAMAADVAGKWTAEVQGRNGVQTSTFTFTVEGEKLSGTVAGARGENAITDGMAKGDDVAFNVAVSFNGNDMKMVYKGKISGDEIKFTRTVEGREGPAQEFTAKRAK
ncbi:MAG: hypothetical protein ABIR28_10255 [Vicinamibacteria bacterium]